MLFQSIRYYSQQFAQLSGDRTVMENSEGNLSMGLPGSESIAAFTEKCLANWRLLGSNSTPDQLQPDFNECTKIQPKIFSPKSLHLESLRFVRDHHNSTGGKLRQAF